MLTTKWQLDLSLLFSFSFFSSSSFPLQSFVFVKDRTDFFPFFQLVARKGKGLGFFFFIKRERRIHRIITIYRTRMRISTGTLGEMPYPGIIDSCILVVGFQS